MAKFSQLGTVVLGCAMAALLVAATTRKSDAAEAGTFTNSLSGVSVGIPAGAAPPSGIYAGLELVFPTITSTIGNSGFGTTSSTGVSGRADAAIGVVPIIWSTGWNFLGASYSAAVIQPFYTAGITTTVGPPFLGSITVPVVANTVWQPINLSWNLGRGWFVSAAFSFMAPDGSQWAGTPNPDYWSFEPGWAISYLDKDWILSANMGYSMNTASRGNCCSGGSGVFALAGQPTAGNGYVSGNQFYLDATALYKIGKWQFGPVGYLDLQTTNDRPGAGVTCAALAGTIAHCGLAQQLALGGLVGYDFGPVTLQAWATDQFLTRDAGFKGVMIWGRLGFRLWAPEPPNPLITKN
jgi:hypothetical protein